jgi:PAS domain S-box-containing protein
MVLIERNGRRLALETNRDVTARKAAEEAMRESEERYRATFEQAAVGIARVALDGRWLEVNERLCEITGYAREELLKRTFQDVTHLEDLGADLAQVGRLLAGEISTYSMDKRYLRKSGDIIWVNLTVSLVHDEGGAPKYFISAVEEITRRKEAEAEVRRLNEQLEGLVAERTARLEEVVKELDAFAYSVSHDLRAPLRAMHGHATALLEDYADEMDEQARKYAERVVAASERMDTLI